MWRKIFYLLLGILIFFFGIYWERMSSSIDTSSERIIEVLKLIDDYYVDTLDKHRIDERVIPLLLAELDPHSAYLSAEENQSESEGLDGSFEGIGIQFNRITDTVIVTRVIDGGGAQRAGLQPGDRILSANDTKLLGKDLDNDTIMKQLKGERGSVVHLNILRKGESLIASVVRGAVPLPSLDIAYKVKDNILYIRLNKWGGETYSEFIDAYARYQSEGVDGIILDLRDNGGGYLDAAVKLAGEFLPSDVTVVYTEGRMMPRHTYRTDRDGLLMNMPLVVLVNEHSASASEIFAGAMQDHDRAYIVGRRTFGKGLVQRPFDLSDNSVIRLTVARYYMPSGRSIQKSYADGMEAYIQDLNERYGHGELLHADSVIQRDTTKYYTQGRRVVYGGGGVTPDFFVPHDTVGVNSYYLRLLQSGTLPEFAFRYADRRRELLSSHSIQQMKDYLRAQGNTLLFDYAYYAQRQGVAIRATLLHQSASVLLNQLYALIIDNLSNSAGAYFVIANERSAEVMQAIKLLDTGQWKPQVEQQ